CAEITIRGIVQGVGFRPFVYRQAKIFGIRGTVKNISGEVEIEAAGKNIAAFVESIKQEKPPLSFIESITVKFLDTDNGFADFSIIESEKNSRGSDLRFFSPDLALCENCRAEILDAKDRRYRHFFNTCTACGPRFSVLKSFPYDRPCTSMDIFPMCAECSAEYHSPGDRRFRAETVCCNNCGPALFYKRGETIYKGEEAFLEAARDLPEGIAIKGIGGYHLACPPSNAAAVRNLRLLKSRETKPFAVMFRDLDAAAGVCEFSPEEKTLLCSPARPIVLLRMKAAAEGAFAAEVLNNAGGRCGCFLPYTPLQELLLQFFPCLVMTSANKSSSPIIKDDSEIFRLTDRVLWHNREIIRSLEDSVAQVSMGRPSLIRRARGYTPLPVFIKNSGPELLASGGDLKAAFGLLKQNVFTLSQYFGDLENAEVFGQYEKSISDFERLFAVQIRAVACDAHPRYLSSRLAKQISAGLDLPLVKIYHHHAHAASVMAEHSLSRVLGVVFDGSGYGEDGNIWGGEFLLCEEGNCRRVGHLENIEILGQDEAARDAAKTASCYLNSIGIAPESTLLKAALENHVNTFLTSSMGRLFDAVAAILGICRVNSYEGECAVLLQYKAEEEACAGIKPIEMHFSFEVKNGITVFGCHDILQKSLEGRAGTAFGFHLAICDMIEQMCLQMRDAEQINDIAFSGGVFQNAFLSGMAKNRLAALGFSVFTNEAVPVNDGGLALGQAFVAGRSGTEG
ncbi:MAG: carbamoyltransferase HypF, partial [Treponema sp.]|nr:carbamoyltransferase HypF [Treponema sp.]